MSRCRQHLACRCLQESISVRPETVQQNSRATGQVNVTIDKHGSASYEFAADAAWDNLQWSADLVNLAANADAVCWGTLGQRSQASKNVIRKFVTATKPECLRVLDINLRSPFWNESLLKDSLPMANVLKCNEDELPVLSSTFDMNGDDHSILLQLQQRFSLKLVALTRGAQDNPSRRHGRCWGLFHSCDHPRDAWEHEVD